MAEDRALEELLAPVRERNRPRLLARLAKVRNAITDPRRVVDDDLWADLHALIGALGTYGWPDGSVLVADIQRALDGRLLVEPLLAPLDALIGQVAGVPASTPET